MAKATECRPLLNVGDRVKILSGTMRGHTGRVSEIHSDGSYYLIGDWTQITGFVLVNYGPIEAEALEKIS